MNKYLDLSRHHTKNFYCKAFDPRLAQKCDPTIRDKTKGDRTD
ncbi:hypothetical protein [Nostoc sp. CmiVER01]